MSGEHITKDNYKCQRRDHVGAYLVITATDYLLSFSYLQLFVIPGLSQLDQLNLPWKMEKGDKSHSVTVQKEFPDFKGSHDTISLQFWALFIFWQITFHYPLFLIHINKDLQWISFSFFKILFNDRSLPNHKKIFLRTLFSFPVVSSDTMKFHIIFSLHLIKHWQNLFNSN